jgi:hypothetical protein
VDGIAVVGVAFRVLVALLTLAGVVGVPAVGWAECVSLPSTDRQIFERYPLVFIADVVEVDEVIEPEPFRYRVRFKVLEAFKGVEPGERILDFATTPEDFKFKAGTRVLVYTSRSEDRHSTACTPTRVIYGDGWALALRKLASGAKRP